LPAVALLVLSLTAAAFATDGCIEINQAKVLAALGVFPYIANQPGCYRLTGNLTVPAGKHGIIVIADNVTVDLNGFAIVSAGASSSNAGIFATADNCTVYNGTVKGFTTGVLIATNARVEKVRSISNVLEGIQMEGGIAVGNTLVGNGDHGLVYYNNSGYAALPGGYSNNYFNNNGVAVTGGVNAGGNICGLALCP
jgi:hypothetical protein